MNYIKYSIAGTSLQNLIKPRHCETRWQIVSLLQVVVSGQGQLPAPVDNDHPPIRKVSSADVLLIHISLLHHPLPSKCTSVCFVAHKYPLRGEASTQREICRNVHRVCFTKRLEHTHTTGGGGCRFFLKHATSTLVMVTQEFCSIVTSKQQVKQKFDLIISISRNVFCNMTITDTNCIYNITLYDLKLQ